MHHGITAGLAAVGTEMHICQMALACDSRMMRFVFSVGLAYVISKRYGAQLCCTRQVQWEHQAT